GMTVDEVLSAWAGGGTMPAPAATPEPADEAATSTPPSPAETDDGPPTSGGAEETAQTPPLPEAQPTPAQPTGAPSRAPMPTEVTSREAARLPEVITVPTAGIRERTNSSIPRWLTTLL